MIDKTGAACVDVLRRLSVIFTFNHKDNLVETKLTFDLNIKCLWIFPFYSIDCVYCFTFVFPIKLNNFITSCFYFFPFNYFFESPGLVKFSWIVNFLWSFREVFIGYCQIIFHPIYADLMTWYYALHDEGIRFKFIKIRRQNLCRFWLFNKCRTWWREKRNNTL